MYCDTISVPDITDNFMRDATLYVWNCIKFSGVFCELTYFNNHRVIKLSLNPR